MSETNNNRLPTFRTDDDRRLHPYCQQCKKETEAADKDWSKTTQRCEGVYDIEDFVEIATDTGLSVEEVEELYNPSFWIEKYLGMKPHWYQDQFIRCTSSRKALRLGRRAGKTQGIAAWILFMCMTYNGLKVLSATPHKSQAKEVFDRITDLISDGGFKNEVKIKQTPYYEINFINKSRIRIFVAGAAGGHGASTIRGQEADVVYLDEMDYIDDEAAKAILPILSDPQRQGREVQFTVSSTPSGKEGMFFRFCHDEYYREFHVPAKFRPDWNEQMEQESRVLAKTEQIYDQEFNALWGIKADGVFKRNDVIKSMKEFRYWRHAPGLGEADWPEMRPWPHWTYMMGVDWNGGGKGTRIVILGFDPSKNCSMIAYREKVDIAEMALHVAIERIVELNRVWRPARIYIDAGFGQFQDEYLRGIGREAERNKYAGKEYEDADLTLLNHLKAVDFGASIEYEYKDPGENEVKKRKIRTKNYMVENLQRHFELNDLWFSKSDQELKQELMNYSIKSKDTHGFFTYKADEELGDHDLDALMLAAFAFNEASDIMFRKPQHEGVFYLTKRPGGQPPGVIEDENDVAPNKHEDPIAYQQYMLNKKKDPAKRHAGVPSREIKKPVQSHTSYPGVVVHTGQPAQTRGNPLSRPRQGRNSWRKNIKRPGGPGVRRYDL